MITISTNNTILRIEELPTKFDLGIVSNSSNNAGGEE